MSKALMTSLATAAFGSALLLAGAASAEPVRGVDAVAQRQASEPLASYAQFRQGRAYSVRRGYYGEPRYYGRRNSGAGIAAGVIGGLAAGAIIGGAIASQQAQAAPGVVYQPAPGVVYADPGSDADAYCAARFRSYDPRSGTYLGYDGLRHACP
jgi:hypothetical protein